MTLISSNVIFLLVIFPYLSPFRTPFDTQPWAVAAAGLFALGFLASGRGFRIPRPLAIFLLIAFYAALVYVVRSDPIFGLRSLAGYISVFLFALVGYKTYRYVKVGLYVASVWIWFAVGFIQLLFAPRFGEWILPRLSTGGPRGVTSLAVEPSFYAIVCIFLLLLNEMFYNQRKYGTRLYLAIMLALTVQVLITYSVTGFLFLLIFGAAKLLTIVLIRYRKRSMGAAILVGFAMLIALGAVLRVEAFQRTRAGHIARATMSSPISLLFRDASIADRTAHMVISHYSLVQGNGLGFGLGTWNENADALALSAGGWVKRMADVSLSKGGRIFSGWGTAVYELGLVGALFVFTAVYVFARSIWRTQRLRPTCALSAMIIFALLAMALPIAFPLFGYLLGIHLYYGYGNLTADRYSREELPPVRFGSRQPNDA